MDLNIIYNEDCIRTMEERINPKSVDCILTSPPYNTSRTNCDFHNDTKKGRYTNRYVDFNDMKSDEEYSKWTLSLFEHFEKILKENGAILYNINYGKNTHDTFYKLISEIIEKTPFTVADTICWKKNTAVPNSASSNKLTRIWEPIFVFVRKNEYATFHTNKKVVSLSKSTNQKNYENVRNHINAANNDGSCKIHKATYSTELCSKILNIYCPDNGIVYDPFIGTGTTAKACIELGINYIGSEIYKPYYDLAIENIQLKLTPNEKNNTNSVNSDEIQNDLNKLHKTLMKQIISFCYKHNLYDINYLTLYVDNLKHSINENKWKASTDSCLALYKKFDDIKNGQCCFESL